MEAEKTDEKGTMQWCFDLVDCRDIVDYSLVACPVKERAKSYHRNDSI